MDSMTGFLRRVPSMLSFAFEKEPILARMMLPDCRAVERPIEVRRNPRVFDGVRQLIASKQLTRKLRISSSLVEGRIDCVPGVYPTKSG
jgi:hypothetical protein